MTKPFSQNTPYCKCSLRVPFKITLTYEQTPLVCLQCDGLIALDTLEIPEDYRLELIAWHREYGAVHKLMHESGVYSTWTRSELRDIKSPINEAGRLLTEGLPEAFSAYFAVDTDNDPAPTSCPRCSCGIEPLAGYETAGPVCKACCLIFPAHE